MISDLSSVELADILKKSQDRTEIDPSKIYRRVTVRLWGKGVVQRGEVLGAEIAAKKQIVVHSGQFILSRIDARHGAFGLIPDSLDGAVVSSDFPVFTLDRSRILPEFLEWMSRARGFVEICKAASEGTTNRVRLKEDQFLNTKISLPSLDKQRRIVERLSLLTSKLEEARHLRARAADDIRTLLDACTTDILQRSEMKPFFVRISDADLELNRETRDPARINPKGEFAYVDISSVGEGPSILSDAKVLPSSQAPSRARRVIHREDIIFSTVRPNLRAVAKVGKELDNQICSTGFAVFSCGQSIDPDFLLYQLCSSFFIDQCITRTTGAHYPAINETNLREVLIAVPPLPRQRRIAAHLKEVQARVGTLKTMQAETATELEVLPSLILGATFNGLL